MVKRRLPDQTQHDGANFQPKKAPGEEASPDGVGWSLAKCPHQLESRVGDTGALRVTRGSGSSHPCKMPEGSYRSSHVNLPGKPDVKL